MDLPAGKYLVFDRKKSAGVEEVLGMLAEEGEKLLDVSGLPVGQLQSI